MRRADSSGLVWVQVGCTGRMDLLLEQASVVHRLEVRVGHDVCWSVHVGGRREGGHDHTIAHAWEACKGVIGERHGPLVLEERGWRGGMDIEDRPDRHVVLRGGGWSRVLAGAEHPWIRLPKVWRTMTGVEVPWIRSGRCSGRSGHPLHRCHIRPC